MTTTTLEPLKGGCCSTSVEVPPSSPTESQSMEETEKESVRHKETCSCGSIEEGQVTGADGRMSFRKKIGQCCNVS